ncbi:MAG: DUF2452 domain-containing protein [Woeseiaceae bacterium]
MASSELIKVGVNPEGKGVNGLMADWRATEPRGVVAKPPHQVLGELFVSMLVLSASFKYRPVPGNLNYLYWIDDKWSLSLIAPQEWSQHRRDNFVGACVLNSDMTWSVTPSEELTANSPMAEAIRRYLAAFSEMLNTKLTLEEILPFHVSKLPYYQRLYASALSRSVSSTLSHSRFASVSCREWRKRIVFSDRELPGRIGFDLAKKT